MPGPVTGAGVEEKLLQPCCKKIGVEFAEKENLIWKIQFEAGKSEFTNFFVQAPTVWNVLSPRFLCGCSLLFIQILISCRLLREAFLDPSNQSLPIPTQSPSHSLACIHSIFYVLLIEIVSFNYLFACSLYFPSH